MIPNRIISPTTPGGWVVRRWSRMRKATRLGTGDLSLTALGFWVGLSVVEAEGRRFLTDRDIAEGLVTLCHVLDLTGVP